MRLTASTKIYFLVLLGGSNVVLTQCSSPLGDMENRGSTLFGSSKKTQFYVEAQEGQPIVAKDLYRAARVIGKYRDLNRSEAEILEAVAREKFNFLVALEYETLRPKYEPKILAVKNDGKARRTRIHKAQNSGKLTREAAIVESAKIDEEAERKIAAIEIDWKKEAQHLAEQRMGSNAFAVAVKAEKDKNLVGVAHIVADGVKISKSLLEIEKPLLVLDDRSMISYEGKVITVLQTQPISINEPSGN